LSPSPAENSRPSRGKPAPVKEPEGNGKKTVKKPDISKVRQKRQPATSDHKGKRKALPDDDSSDTLENVNDKATKLTKTKAQKSRTMAKESHPANVEVDSEDTAVPKKKKMKKLNVNIFAPAKPDSLDWANQFNLGGGGLDIPTELSPVKVPARSLAINSVTAPFRKS
jgi:hypothetical protein